MIRISGGSLKGQKLYVPDTSRLRPTSSKVREAIFNSLQFEIENARVLDLFAGAGTLGLEALSRGAAYVTFVDSKNAAAIRKNAQQFQMIEKSRILSMPVEKILDQLDWSQFDFIFADPPYDQGFVEMVVRKAGKQVKSASIWIEHSKREQVKPEWLGSLEIVREKNYGDTWLTTLRYGGPNAHA